MATTFNDIKVLDNTLVYTSWNKAPLWNKTPFVKQSTSFEDLLARAEKAGYEFYMETGAYDGEKIRMLEFQKVTKVDDIPNHDKYDAVFIALVPAKLEKEFRLRHYIKKGA